MEMPIVSEILLMYLKKDTVGLALAVKETQHTIVVVKTVLLLVQGWTSRPMEQKREPRYITTYVHIVTSLY